MKKIMNSSDLVTIRKKGLDKLCPSQAEIRVGMGTCGIGNGADTIFNALEKLGDKKSGKHPEGRVHLQKTGCFGYCSEEPMLSLHVPDKPVLLFTNVSVKQATALAEAAASGNLPRRLLKQAAGKIESWDFISSKVSFGQDYPDTMPWHEIPFFKGQQKLVLRNAGLINPEDIEEYIGTGGYGSFIKALESMQPQEVIDEVAKAGLRGRGGAGFPTARKWTLLAEQENSEKWLICNADEGDPGAYMNRNELESDPHSLVEGMLIGAYATGATKGFIYVRAEYPLAVERLQKAIVDAREYGLLGKNIAGTDICFDLEIVCGAGAFVCGEETALIASAEGKAGRPLPRPPFPAQKGYRETPTNINNVETWYNIPCILARGGEWFSGIGTAKSSGTKVFSLVGKVQNTGLIELPLGTKLETAVYTIGGGAGMHKHIKAIQSGGPSGGCIPSELFDASIDYESLATLGAIMGSGGMVVMDQDNCMVDVAKYFVSFTASESCGKCTPCREGLSQMLRLLNKISSGEGSYADLDTLERLSRTIKDAALCGLGQTAANPVLTTLQYFRDEYEQHIRDQRCEAGTCEDLYLALCENSCPLHMNIPGYLALIKEGRLEEAYELTLIDNPLPGSLGRICHYHCSTRCRRESIDDPVQQGEIHRYLADTMRKTGQDRSVWKRLAAEKAASSGKKIAIIGAGPAGLCAAFYLSRLGHAVTIYDSKKKAGGILRYGIPAYRLPKEVLDHELGLFTKLGVEFVPGVRLGRDIRLAELEAGYDAVLCSIGAQKDRNLNIPGEDSPGVYQGYEYLDLFAEKKAPKLGNKVLIIGGGNVAIDAARTLIRQHKEVTVVYRRTRTDMPANIHELQGADEEGVTFKYMLSPREILKGSDGRIKAVRFEQMKPGPIDSSGRPRPIPTGITEDLACSDLLVAVGETVDSEALNKEGLSTHRDGRIKTDPFTNLTSRPLVWASGDAVEGPATAAEAMGEAKRTAREIDRVLSGKDRFTQLFKQFTYNMEIPVEHEGSRKNRPRHIPPDQRIGNYLEINTGYDGDQAISEVRRCLRCDVRPNARSPWR